ncbi:glycosyl hydrolases family 31-domain-containing protein [Dactylonectria macrodidyma]|uniref:Glycosyl hydrolases family 31-domain-containing protein n=1 Tax=Dactylonectria macrodidyma TaxID=307937 RepID=A0A9P9DV62_9HYPO|nr:glycosyl hydrolases family 31-domain-containing protein [Dactylonectria macrodidyma]
MKLMGILLAAKLTGAIKYNLKIENESPFAFSVSDQNGHTLLSNLEILAGSTNDTVEAVDNNSENAFINVELITSSIVQVQVNSSLGFTGATFEAAEDAKHYGVWGYPWNKSLQNTNIHFDLKGLQSKSGISYSSARSPFFLSSTGYGVYTDTQAMGSYSFSDDELEVKFVFNTTALVYYIILPSEEGDVKSILRQYAKLTDRSALWPSRSYGPMFWHNDFQRTSGFPEGVNNSQQFVQDVVNKLSENRIRASTIMVDRPYGTGKEGWGNFDFDGNHWPDIGALVEEVSERGLDFQVWVANRAVPGSELHDEASENGWLFDEMVTDEDASVAMNLSIPEAYDYFLEQQQYFTDIGIKGYKIDRGDEDEMPVWEQNIQSYLYHKLLYENQARAWGGATTTKPAGFYNFARSVVDRSRKYTGVWNGDPAATTDGLLASITSGIRAGLLGFPMWGSDCGGYGRKVGQELPKEKVWARWMWFSAFSPVYELMLYEDSIPWYDYSDELVEVLRNTTALHHELIPYIQSYMYRATNDGLPIIRATFLEEPEDENTWDIDESYFFGQEFLICPITADDNTKKVYFPTGSKYLEYFGKSDVYNGGEEVTIQSGVDSVPAFVREGSIITRGDLNQVNNNWDEDWAPWLNIEVYPSFNFPKKTFPYFVEKTGQVVKIQTVASREKDKICVSYGAVGVTGKVLIYVKDGPKEFSLRSSGGKACVEGAETLFD